MSLETTTREIEAVLSPIRKAVEDIAVQVRAMYSVGFFGHEHMDEMGRQAEGVIRRALTHNSGTIVGAGFVWQHTGKDDAGMLWWRADGDGITPKVHVYNPQADAFYDYRQTEWYRQGAEEAGFAIAGPFIDAWGTDDHALTPSTRIVSDPPEERFLGVAAVDLQVHRVTERLASVLKAAPGAVIVNAEGHVVSANRPLLTPGLRLERILREQGNGIKSEAPLFVRGWRLLSL